MLRAVLKKRTLAERMLEKIEVIFAELGHALEECGIDGLMVADPLGSSTVISPRFYKELVLPYLRHFIKGLKTVL